MIGIFSRSMLRQPAVKLLAQAEVRGLNFWHWLFCPPGLSAVAGWGFRKTTCGARAYAMRQGVPYIAFEDGFLRSFGTGQDSPALSLTSDRTGVYYAANHPSDLEQLLASDQDLLAGIDVDCLRAMDQILEARLSKYNLAPDVDAAVLGLPDDARRILVVDQTVGDAGVTYGNAGTDTFARMLDAAREENPGAMVYVKTHPEVSSGAKRGYYATVKEDANTVLLRETINPLSLIAHMDRVYVVTSHFGFEALLAGKPVSCFGMPWYAGWGVTDDRQHCARRNRIRSVPELFAGAYWHYTRYLSPETYRRGNIFDVIAWLRRQREMASKCPGRTIAVGFKRWKARNVEPFLGSNSERVRFVRDAAAAARLNPGSDDRLVVWGADPAQDLIAMAKRTGASFVRMEDGFIRSVGLGSDFVPPASLVLDKSGIYFDPRQPSDLEHLLNTMPISEDDRRRARCVRSDIVRFGLTKYNVEPRQVPTWRADGRRVVLVPGQVEDDASIRYGCESVCTNLDLLEEVRRQHPKAFIVYKPHPDVFARNRNGRVHIKQAVRYADVIETDCSIVSCLEACDEVHTMTSLAGFDALLRGKPVTVYGRPFYAGWGLTEDRLPVPRRERRLDIDALVAGVLLHYPVYWDPHLKGFTTCEAVIAQLVRQRDLIIARYGPRGIRMGRLRRCWRKVKLWAQAGFILK